jgi:hypothetical protein
MDMKLYDAKFDNDEIEFLKSKKIVRNNLIKYNPILVNKIDEFSNKYDLVFNESIYIITNNIKLEVVCENCKLVKPKFISTKSGYKKYCSVKCSNSHTETIENKRKTNLEKYGVDNPSKSEEVKRKISIVNSNQSDETKEKRSKTNLERYGYESNVLSPKIAEKRRNKLKDDSVVEKRKSTNLERYGSESTLGSDIIRNKIKKIWKKKYGTNHFSKSEIYKELRKNRHLEKLNSEISDLNFIDIESSTYLIECLNCGEEFEINNTPFNLRRNKNLTICTNCNPVQYNKSLYENELVNIITNLYPGDIKTSYRIENKELDIYLPQIKLGIEFNGVYWHSEHYKDKNYHYDKFSIMEKNGINLFQIWEDDFIYKQDIIKSMLKNKLGKSKRIYGRKCEIRNVGSNDSKKFLNDNHIQGWCVSKLRYGLYFENELVSLMTFGKKRLNLGNKKSNKNEWELLRFCI